MRKVLGQEFFNRPALVVSKELLGKYLVRRVGERESAFMIVETEAYFGFEDMGSHAHRGQTQRNKVMFGEAGRWYVYFVYGMHWMLNVVVGRKDYPAAILFRGAGEYDGPAKLTKFIDVNKSLNGKLALPASGLWFEDRGFFSGKNRRRFIIRRLPRVGVHYAGPVWSKKLYRFKLERKT